MGMLSYKRRIAAKTVKAKAPKDLAAAVRHALVERSKAVFFAEVLDAYAEDHARRESPSLIDILTTNRVWLFPALGHLDWQEVTPKRLLALREVMERMEKAPHTIRRTLGQAKAAMTFAHSRGLIEHNPLPTLRTVVPAKRTVRKRAEKLLTQKALETLINHPEVPVLYRVLYITAATHGLRSGELLELRPSDICRDDPEGAVLRLSRQYSRKRATVATLKEGGGDRVIPMRKDVLAILDWWIATGRPQYVGAPTELDDLLFMDMRRVKGGGWEVVPHRLFDKTLLNRFKGHLALCGLEERVFHSLRHGFVALMIDAGIPLDVIREFTHPDKKARAIDIYAHYSPRVLREAVEKPRLRLPSWVTPVESEVSPWIEKKTEAEQPEFDFTLLGT